VTPVDCNGEIVDGRIPDALLDRFAVLRGDSGPVELSDDQVPGIAAQVIRQSLRELEGPRGTRYVFAAIRLADMNCAPSDHGVCLISEKSEFCTVLQENALLGYVIDDLPGDRRVLAVVAEDRVPTVQVSQDRRGVIAELDMEANVAFEELPAGEDLEVTPAGEQIPLNCSTAPALSALKENLAIFRREPGSVPAGFDVDLPQGWHQIYLDQIRRVGDEHYAFPATDASCATGVCLVSADDPKAECQTVERGTEIVVMLVKREGERARVAGLVRDAVDEVVLTVAGGSERLPVKDNFVSLVAPSDEFQLEGAS
jgi:hypothetical protein